MSIIDKRNEIRPASGEAPFNLDEVFFSRTDNRGVIQAGNYVFKRVAHYEWEELLDAPHKILRHPDTPKGVFQLFWDTLKKGEVIGAYVKNKTKDGLYYWVYAVAMPCPGGYLSARIKPTSENLKIAQGLYADLTKAELDEGISPEQSRDLLLEKVVEMGFDNYAHFSSHSLTEELICRSENLGQQTHADILHYRKMLEFADNLKSVTSELVEEFGGVKIIPHNMRVIASRIEPAGGPVSTLSKNYAFMSDEISNWFDQNVIGEKSNFSTIKDSVVYSMFTKGMSSMLSLCDAQLNIERRQLGAADIERERQILSDLAANYVDISTQAIRKVTKEAARIRDACRDMRRHVMGLNSMRAMCKIESSRIAGNGESLEDIIDQLLRFEQKIGSHISQIEQQSSGILADAADIV